MTYCLVIRVRDGLVGLADARITAGTQVSTARKVTMLGDGTNRIMLMTSGLRSIRDKALGYLRADLASRPEGQYPGIGDAVAAFAGIIRRVAEEDRESLKASELVFNTHTLIAGRLANDRTSSAYLIYPEGNWIEVDTRTPYLAIGATTYGKPVLDRALTFDTPLSMALKLAYLSFDSTRFSSADVGYPIDMITFTESTRLWREDQFDYDDLIEQRSWWNSEIKGLVNRMPAGPWSSTLLDLATGPRMSVVPGDRDA